MEAEIFYPLKGKVNALGIFVSILMIIGGGYNIFFKESPKNPIFIYYLLISFVGIIFLFLSIRAHFRKKNGLYLNSEAIIIKSDFIKIKIKWEDIKSFNSFDMLKQSWIAINLFDNEKFLSNKNFYSKKLGKIAIKKYGTPISIAVNFYDASRTELLAELNYRLEKYRRN